MLLKGANTCDEFPKGCFPAQERRKIFVEALSRGTEAEEFLERANTLWSMLGFPTYTLPKQDQTAAEARR